MRRPQNSADPKTSTIFGQVRDGGAAIEQAGAAPAAGPILVAAPPDRRLAARLEQPGGAARHAEAHVDRRLPRRDPRERALPDRAPVGAFVEAEMDEGPDEVPRLRVADRDHVADRAGDRIRRALRVRGGAAEERRDVARRRQADAEHQRIAGRCRPAGRAASGRSRPSRTAASASGVPGNGTLRQSANAQSARGTSRTSPWTPAAVSLPTLISRASGCSRPAGGYAGGGLPIVA